MKKTIYILFILIGIIYSNAQETLPIYSDYLTDNIILLHPASAGISDIGKIRITARKQWTNFDNTPQLQTASFHMLLGESQSAIGAVLFNDKVGHFSKTGGQLIYAYHIPLDYNQTNQFSFGLSLNFLQNSLDTQDFILPDSDLQNANLQQTYFNVNTGIAYRYKGLFSFYTLKNILLSKRNLINSNETNNLRKHLFSLGYHFNQDKKDAIKIEPSILLSYTEKTTETFIDTNLKTFFPINNGQIWTGISYRLNLDQNAFENSNYITPFLGIKFSNYVIAYTYTKQVNNIVFLNGNFHQITLGYNFRIHKYRRATWDL